MYCVGCVQVTSSGILRAVCHGSEVMSQLSQLNLSCCSKLDTAAVVKLTQCLPLLHHLDLGSCFLLQVCGFREKGHRVVWVWGCSGGYSEVICADCSCVVCVDCTCVVRAGYACVACYAGYEVLCADCSVVVCGDYIMRWHMQIIHLQSELCSLYLFG